MAGRVWSCLVATGRDSTSFSIALDLVLTPGQRLMPGDRRCFVLFVRGKVFVGTGEDDFASAFRVEDGVFTWVGGADAPDARPLGDEPVMDLQGAIVLPGLLDVHTHPALMAQIADAVDVLPPAVTSIEALVEALRSSPAHGAGPGVWIRGFGFDDAKYPEGRWPDRHDMDRSRPRSRCSCSAATDTRSSATRSPWLSRALRATPPSPPTGITDGTRRAGPTVGWSNRPRGCPCRP